MSDDTQEISSDHVLTDVANILKHALNHQLGQLQDDETNLISAGAVLVAVSRVLRQAGEEWIRLIVVEDQQQDAIRAAEKCGDRSAEMLMPHVRECITITPDETETNPFDVQ